MVYVPTQGYKTRLLSNPACQLLDGFVHQAEHGMQYSPSSRPIKVLPVSVRHGWRMWLSVSFDMYSKQLFIIVACTHVARNLYHINFGCIYLVVLLVLVSLQVHTRIDCMH